MMPIYALAAFAIIGAFAGWLGGMLLKGRGLGFIVNTIAGVIGAFIGGVLATAIGLSAPDSKESMFAAAIGAAALLAILGLTRKALAARQASRGAQVDIDHC
jgi:uncharacterized membrane protein YeaQ/YmgE (transglycosylase-associated protein family)